MTPRARTDRNPRRRNSRGYSLAELLVATAMGLFILGVAATFFGAQQRALRVQNTYAESQNVTRTFTDLLSRELRMAAFDPSGAALVPANDPNWCPENRPGLVEATPTSIRFRQDLNGDGDVTDTGEDVKYSMSGNTIQRTDVDGTPVTLVTGVPNVGLTFRYFTVGNPSPSEYVPSGNPPVLSVGQRNCVAKVLVQVMSSLPNPDPYSSQPLESEVRTEVALRNRSLMNF
jgi:type II secretory pathway component PulJ